MDERSGRPLDSRPRRSTLADVAARAGVSPSSASMALSDSPRISARTKENVRRAASELAYHPHAAGRALRMQRVGALAVAIPDLPEEVFRRPFWFSLLAGIVEVASTADMTTVLSTRGHGQDERVAYERLARSRTADGIVIVQTRLDPRVLDGLVAGVPATVVGKVPTNAGVNSVSSADEQGAYEVVRHLLEVHGVRRVAHVRGRVDRASTIDKRAGYLRALAEAGIDGTRQPVALGGYDAQVAAQAVQQMLPGLAAGDAIFFDSDQMAVGAREVLVGAGLPYPQRLAVVGFDDYVEEYDGPPLTTIRVDRTELGRLAANNLLRHVADPSRPTGHEDLPSPLVVRASCGCA
jgi:LacI family transcriptional regulator